MDFCVPVKPLSMSDADQMFHEPKCPCFSSLVCVAGGDIFSLELNKIGEDTSFKEISPPQLVMVLDKQMIFCQKERTCIDCIVDSPLWRR